jgi:hypothetical protein
MASRSPGPLAGLAPGPSAILLLRLEPSVEDRERVAEGESVALKACVEEGEGDEGATAMWKLEDSRAQKPHCRSRSCKSASTV